MQIRVLGCSGSIAAGSRTTSFLLDDDVLIDAGTGVGDLTLDELARIDHIFISHSHLDHVLADRPAGRQRDAPPQRAAAPPDRGACAARDHRGAAHAHLQRRHLARLHAPARRRAPGAALRADRSRPGAGLQWASASRCCPPRTPCRRSASRVPTAAPRAGLPGSSAATPGPTRRCGRAWRSCAWPRWSSRPPSATTRRRAGRASAATCARPAGRELAQLRAADGCLHHAHQAGRAGAVMTEIGAQGSRAPHPGAAGRAGDGAEPLSPVGARRLTVERTVRRTRGLRWRLLQWQSVWENPRQIQCHCHIQITLHESIHHHRSGRPHRLAQRGPAPAEPRPRHAPAARRGGPAH